MSTEAPLPDLQTAELDSVTLARLFADLASTEVLAVTLKPLAAARALPESVTLERGRVALLAGEVAGIQIHYRHAGQNWCDTLLRVAGCVRLVRIVSSL